MNDFLSTQEAAKYLGLTAGHISDLCKQGKLKCERPSRDWLIPLKELQAYKAKPKNKGGRPRKTPTNTEDAQ